MQLEDADPYLSHMERMVDEFQHIVYETPELTPARTPPGVGAGLEKIYMPASGLRR